MLRVVFPLPGDDNNLTDITEVRGHQSIAVTTSADGLRPGARGSRVDDDDPLLGSDLLGYVVGRLLSPVRSGLAFSKGLAPASPSLEPHERLTSSRRIALPQLGASPPRSQLQQGRVSEQRVYTGDPVSMDFQGADLRAVLRALEKDGRGPFYGSIGANGKIPPVGIGS